MLVKKNTRIAEVGFREYQYPAALPGTQPALGDRVFSLKRKDFIIKGKLERRIAKLPNGRNIGIESGVLVGGKRMHVPMMDFSLTKSKKSLEAIKTVFGKLVAEKFSGGVIVETDNSYHFIGDRLLSERGMNEFLYWSLIAVVRKAEGKLNNLVDVPFVGYSLLKGSMCLRITSYPDKNYLPKVVLKV